MPLANVLTVDIRQGERRRYFDLCQELSESAKSKQDPLQWTTYETRVGKANRIHFVVAAADFTELENKGTPEEMIGRVLGEKRALVWLDESESCVENQLQEISVDRPDLSYMPGETDGVAPTAIVTVVQARPGHQEGLEELIRKLAEAIPKVNDGSQIMTYQTVVGNLLRYWTVRPLESMADLDKQLPAPELLNEAFGAAEGGLIFRSGLEAIAVVERNIVGYRPELSNAD
jgi:hypothetical protein